MHLEFDKDIGCLNTLSAISFWPQNAKKDTASIVNAASVATSLPIRA